MRRSNTGEQCRETGTYEWKERLSLIHIFIIGKLIPAGTGMSCYRNVSLTGLEEESITPKSMPEAVVYPEQEDENLPENTLDNDTLE